MDQIISKKRKVIFVSSPLKGDIKMNIERAKKYCRNICLYENCIPIAPHIYFTSFLNDGNDYERSVGMDYGLQLLTTCDELWAYCYNFNSASEGMKTEIMLAHKLNIPVIYKG